MLCGKAGNSDLQQHTRAQMQTNTLKSFAPQARREFIQSVTDRAHVLGLSEKSIAPVEVQGDVALIEGRPFPKNMVKPRQDLETRIKRQGFAQIMENVSSTGFFPAANTEPSRAWSTCTATTNPPCPGCGLCMSSRSRANTKPGSSTWRKKGTMPAQPAPGTNCRRS